MAVAWFFVRVIPKPIRATYPCQQAAFPLASAFIIWLLGVKSGLVAWSRCRRGKLRPVLAVGVGICLCGIAAFAATKALRYFSPAKLTVLWVPTDAPNSPIGVARGINPGRVVWMHDPLAMTWDGNESNGTYWWDENAADQIRVDAMLSRSLRALTSTTNDAAAWDALFRYFNEQHGNGSSGYTAGERIAIKINQNTARTGYARNGNNRPEDYGDFSINTNPHLLKAMLRQLVHNAGIAEADILIYDASRYIADNVYLPNHAEFADVRFMDNYGYQGREYAQWSQTNVISYAGEHDLGRNLPIQVLEATYLINLSIMKNHGDGPTLCAKNHYGSINGQGDHNYIYNEGRMDTYSPLVDLMGHKHLGEKTVLFMIDGLYSSRTQNADPTKWNSLPFNGWWPCSLFLSQDGVAIDSVGFDFMNMEWGMAQNSDNYLHEAAQADKSSQNYAPNDDSVRVSSLGVHEHWNDSIHKQYSRNLSTNGTGIELLQLGAKAAIIEPEDQASLSPNPNITITADVSIDYTTVNKLEFFRDAQSLGVLTTPPWTMVWSNPPMGTYGLSVVGTDAEGLSVTSAVVTVTIQPTIVLAPPANNENAFRLELNPNGSPCSVWVSTNLIDWWLWLDLPDGSGPLEVFTSLNTNEPAKFYRMRVDP